VGANIVAYWVVAFPVAVVLGLGNDQGPHGLWWGVVAGLTLAAAILTIKFAIVSREPIALLEAG